MGETLSTLYDSLARAQERAVLLETRLEAAEQRAAIADKRAFDAAADAQAELYLTKRQLEDTEMALYRALQIATEADIDCSDCPAAKRCDKVSVVVCHEILRAWIQKGGE